MSQPRRSRRKAPIEHDPRALREARIRAGMRQQELAQAVGVVPSVLSEAERGTRGISIVVRNRVAKVLNCDPVTFAPLAVDA